MIRIVNLLFNAAGNLIMLPFRSLNPWFGVFAFSLVIAVLAMLAFRWFSNPAALGRARNRAFARILEFRLFKDDILAVFGIFARVVSATGGYLKHYLLPIAVMIVPVMLLLVQMAAWYELRPLAPGETALVRARLRPGHDVMSEPLQLVAPDGVVVDTDALRVPSRNELVWRIRVAHEGGGDIQLVAAGHEDIAKSVTTGYDLRKVSSKRMRTGAIARLAHPSEGAIPSESPVERIEIEYPRRSLPLGSGSVNWLVACFVLTIVLGLAMKPIFRVEL